MWFCSKNRRCVIVNIVRNSKCRAVAMMNGLKYEMHYEWSDVHIVHVYVNKQKQHSINSSDRAL